MKNRLLVITTLKDISIPFFFDPEILEGFEVSIIIYEFYLNDISGLSEYLKNTDIVYLRDPFNSKINKKELPKLLEKIIMIVKDNKVPRLIDQLSSVDEIYLEDKYEQYKIFEDFMPATRLYKENDQKFQKKQEIIKERISSRSEGIYFSIEDAKAKVQDDQAIVQKMIQIKKEFRVIIAGGQVIDLAVIKRSKMRENELKVIGKESISPELKEYVNNILSYAKSKGLDYDLIGLDVAETESGKFTLIEYNRSPQINGFFSLTKINPFLIMMKNIIL